MEEGGTEGMMGKRGKGVRKQADKARIGNEGDDGKDKCVQEIRG